MEDNTFKMIIVVCLVAIVAILGVSAYFFINNTKENDINSTLSANQTAQNASVVKVTTENTSKSTHKTKTNDKPAVISGEKANEIVTEAYSGYECYGSGAKLFTSNDKPVYSVTLWNKDGSQAGEVIVDAETGKILS